MQYKPGGFKSMSKKSMLLEALELTRKKRWRNAFKAISYVGTGWWKDKSWTQ